MSLINYSRYKYTPDEMAESDFIERFVVRDDEFHDIFDDVKSTDYTLPSQHHIIIGQRGQGKTSLLRRIQIEVKNDEKLNTFLIPVKFAEEQYQIRNLSRLWEEVADYLQSVHEDEFDGVLDNIEEHFDDDDYEFKSFSYLEKELKQRDKKVLLLVDNIDELLGKLKEKEQRRLREILLESSSFKIIGGSTKMLEQHFDYGKPFYEFFKIIRLQGLNQEDSFTFLRAIGKGKQKEKINSIIENEPQRIETLRRLTGGVPRTLVMLYDILLDDGGDTFEDLLKVLDEATPLYKHRMDDLPPVLQDIVHAMAINWDGMYTKEIAKKTRLQSKEVSAQLKQLEKKYGIVESESVGKNKIYKIQERFFNIWYLMRFGRKKDRQRVEWLVKFLVSWCTPEELEMRSKKLIENIKDGKVSESYAFHMCEALGYCEIDGDLEDVMNDTTKKYLENIESKYINDLSQSDKKIFIDSIRFYDDDDFENSLLKMKQIKNKSQFDLERIIHIDYLIEKCNTMPFIMDSDNFEKKYINKYAIILILLVNEDYEKAYKKFEQLLDFCTLNKIEISLIIIFYVFMKQEQYHKLKEFLEIQEYNLKEQYKPIWFALMILMKDEFPDEIKKMGIELEESVDEVLKQIEKLKF